MGWGSGDEDFLENTTQAIDSGAIRGRGFRHVVWIVTMTCWYDWAYIKDRQSSIRLPIQNDGK